MKYSSTLPLKVIRRASQHSDKQKEQNLAACPSALIITDVHQAVQNILTITALSIRASPFNKQHEGASGVCGSSYCR